MGSITKRMKKLSVQRDQYINPMTGKPYTRLKLGMQSYATAAELRADKEHARSYARLERAHDKQDRKMRKPEYCAGGEWWVLRKTPDRSILKQQRISVAGVNY